MLFDTSTRSTWSLWHRQPGTEPCFSAGQSFKEFLIGPSQTYIKKEVVPCVSNLRQNLFGVSTGGHLKMESPPIVHSNQNPCGQSFEERSMARTNRRFQSYSAAIA